MNTKLLCRTGLVGLVVLTALYLVAPVFVVVPTSFNDSSFLEFPPKAFSTRWYESFFSDPAWVNATLNSLQIGFLVTILSAVLGTAAAMAMVRGRYPVKALVSGLVLAPILVPYVIIGLAVYALFLEIGLTQSILGFVLVHTALAVPFVVINVSAALVSFDERLEMASMSLGANRLTTFLRVTLPCIAPSVAAGALFAFITSFDEVVVSVFLAGPDVSTLPVQMWSGVRVQIDPTVAAVSTMLLLVTLALFASAGLVRVLRSRRLAKTS
ncbi:ABC transporter permease [Nocardioides sp. CPCC 206347]|uniref:ABC transporter permease n=1 Tax=unclassified Nocardioides TaxID=2615069 RepID=UPI0036119E62